LPQVEAELSDVTNVPRVGAEIYTIPWGHIKVIVDKCKGNPEKALFFVDEVIKNNWSRAVLLNFLDTDLFERQGKALTNFRRLLPDPQSDLARAEQQSKATGSSIRTTTSSISVTEASIEEARVNMENLQREDARYERLLAQDAVTRQQYDQIHTSYLSAKARYVQMKQTRAMQSNVVEEQNYHLSATEAAVQLAQAAVELAKLNLSYCYIIATHTGYVGSKDVHVGELVNPGQTLVSIVDENSLWVEANYRETQLPHIHEGSEVSIHVDAVPDIEYKGSVLSLADATGSAYSLIPIDNATGNFVKVEQRLTIRIALDDNPAEDLQKLKAGYSVECEVKY